jgi:hypothetical protein
VYSLQKEHIGLLQLMFDHCNKLHISLSLNKCIFCVPFGNMLGHIVCKEGVLVDPTRVVVILIMRPPTNAKHMWSTVGSYWVLSQVIRSYTSINSPLEKMIKKSKVFSWNPECDQAFNILKENVSTTTMIYIDWKVEFHVYIDSSGIASGAILAQLGERNMDHPIYFASRKISKSEHNYTTIERKVFSMAL